MKVYRFSVMAIFLVVCLCLSNFVTQAAPGSALKSSDLANLEGDWIGKYSANQGETKLILNIQKVTTDGTIKAIFNFSALPTNPRVPSGSFKMIGKIDLNSRRVVMKGDEWIKRPSSYYTVDLDGYLTDDGSAIIGDVVNTGRFAIKKVIGTGRSPFGMDEIIK